MRLKTPFETSFGRIETRDCILVELISDGVKAYGEMVADRDPLYSYENVDTALAILQKYLIPTLFKNEINHPLEFFPMVNWIRGHNLAKAGLEMVLWDLYGINESKSLKELIGGNRESVSVGVSIGIKESPEALLDSTTKYLEDGYKRIKIKIKPGREIEETQLIRETYPDLALQVDANSAYTLDSASALNPLDELDLLLIEQPLAEDDIWDHHILQKKLKTPICLDESIHTVRHARQAIEMDASRVINIKPGRVGGLSQGIAIHDLCQRYNIPVWCGGMLETGVGRASNLAIASLPNFSLPGDISASDRYYEEDITEELFSLNSDSTITVPNKPGLGVSINQKAVDRASLQSYVLKPQN